MLHNPVMSPDWCPYSDSKLWVRHDREALEAFRQSPPAFLLTSAKRKG